MLELTKFKTASLNNQIEYHKEILESVLVIMF